MKYTKDKHILIRIILNTISDNPLKQSKVILTQLQKVLHIATAVTLVFLFFVVFAHFDVLRKVYFRNAQFSMASLLN